MAPSNDHQTIIDELYAQYKSTGFIREEEALDMMSAHDVSLKEIEQLTGTLIGLGIIFADDTISNDGDATDYTQTDYEAIFNEVLQISPGQEMFIDYIRGICPPRWREWVSLMPQAKTGNKYAQSRLFEMYLRVVVKLSLSVYKNNGYEIDDLIQEGAMGLMRAIESYDTSKHGSFVSYLPLWIKQYQDRAIAIKSRAIRIPVHMLETMNGFQTFSNTFEQNSGRMPTTGEIANELGITYNAAKQINSYFYEFEPIEDYLIVHDDGFIEYDFIDERILPFEDNFLRGYLLSVLNDLKPREAEILHLRLGFDDGTERTLEEVGVMYNLTRERIRQIEAKAIRKLQHPSRSKMIKDYLTEA